MLVSLLIMYNVAVIVYDMLSHVKLLLVRYSRVLPRKMRSFVVRNKNNCCFCLGRQKKELSKRQKQKLLRKIRPYFFGGDEMGFEVRFEKEVAAVLRDANQIKMEDFVDI